MKAIVALGKATVLVLALLGLSLPGSVQAQNNPQAGTGTNAQVGVVSVLQGQATVTRDGQPPQPLALNDPVYRQDSLETSAGSIVEIELNDGSRFVLDAFSRVNIAAYELGTAPRGLLALAFGRLRSLIATTFSSRRDAFQVQTSEGVIGVQGTEFDVIAMTDETEVFVWVGEVTVAHVDTQFPEVRTVSAGFTVRFRIDEPVPEPQPIQQIPDADLPPPLGPQDAYLPALVAGSRVSWTDECEIPSRPRPSVALEPITIGAEGDVGKESAVEQGAKSVVGGVLSSVLGGSGSRSRNKGPKTRRDPTRKLDYLALTDQASETELGVRGQWTEDGLLISSRVEASPDKGTFHTVFLEDCSGRRLYPEKLEIYKIWARATLTVSWTKTTWVDGSVVDQQSGGWSQSWDSSFGRWGRRGGPQADGPMPIWAQVGYDRAHAGVQQVGAYFRMTPEELEAIGRLAFVAHVSRPALDPVVTVPFAAIVQAGDLDTPALSPVPPPTAAPEP